MTINVTTICKKTTSYNSLVKRLANKLTKSLSKEGKIDLYLVSARQMRLLNKKFRKKDKDTNVLSFVNPEGFPDEVLGEVYLNPVYIKNNNEDLKLMLVHGVLHILGYDHVKNSDKIKMERREKALISKLTSGKS